MAAWSHVSLTLRVDLEKFSKDRAELIIKAIKPKKIIVIGLGSFAILTDNKPGHVVLEDNGRILVRQSELWGMPALGIIHLSGAQISTNSQALLKAHFSGPSSD